jgi:hypothetical protein
LRKYNLPELLYEFVPAKAAEDISKAEPGKGRFQQFGFSSIGALFLLIGAVLAIALLSVVTALLG